MNLTAQQLLFLSQLTDSMFPSGGFVHSEGLETYVQSTNLKRIEDLESLLKTRLLCDWAHTDMIALNTAMIAYHDSDLDWIQDIDARLTAMKIAKEIRQSSSRMGRQTLRTLLALWHDPLLLNYQELIRSEQASGHQAIVFGLACAAHQIDPQAALTAYAYSLVSSQISVALKLMRFGQTHAQQLLWRLQAIIEQAVNESLSRSFDEMGAFVPALDIRAMQHEYLFRRLFNS